MSERKSERKSKGMSKSNESEASETDNSKAAKPTSEYMPNPPDGLVLEDMTNDEVLAKVAELLRPKGAFVMNIGKGETMPNETALRKLVSELVKRGVYPEKSELGSPAFRMVIFYGADWHIFREPHECQHCGFDLRDHKNGPPFKLEIGMIENDFVRRYVCPSCRLVIKEIDAPDVD